jgi:SAM-dependent methyltransferase
MRSLLRKCRKEIKRVRNLRKYRDDSDPRELALNWEEINFNRIAVINRIVSKFKDCDYLEIGCYRNESFDSIATEFKVGVDPVRGGTYRGTSDEFFASNTKDFDVIFIDGLHTYEQVHLDIQNALKCLRKSGYLVLHDVLPRNWIEQHRPQLFDWGPYVSDGWKTSFELLRVPGIDFRIVQIDHGVGVIHKTSSTVRFQSLSSDLAEKQFKFFMDNISSLPIVEWKDFVNWLED